MSYPLTANERLFQVVDDLTDTLQLVVAGRVLSDEWSMPLTTFQVQVNRPDIAVNTFPTGYFALAGKIPRLFPDLAVQAYSLELTVGAPGHESATALVAIPAGSVFPLAELVFTLNYHPVRVQGRVTLAATNSQVVNALVTVADANLATLRSPTRFAHANGTTVRSGVLSTVGAPRVVIENASAFAGQLRLSSTAGMGGGSIVRLGTAAGYTFVVLDSVPEPGVVRLRGTPGRSVNRGEAAQRMTFATDGGAQLLTDDLPAGIGLLPLDGSLGGDALHIDDANSLVAEHHVVGAITDTQGYYRLDGVGRRRAINLHAVDDPPLNDTDRDWLIDHRQPVNTVNLSLTPI
jgi:hypothetical protein